MSGQVYFVAAPGRIKIGYTRRPEHRLKQLQRADMESLVVLNIVAGSRWDENCLHGLLSEHRLRGEWFADNEQVRDVMRRFVAQELTFTREAEPEPAEPPKTAAHDVVDVAMGELRFLLDEIERRQFEGIPSSDLVWFAKFLTDEVIDPLTTYCPSIDFARETVRRAGR